MIESKQKEVLGQAALHLLEAIKLINSTGNGNYFVPMGLIKNALGSIDNKKAMEAGGIMLNATQVSKSGDTTDKKFVRNTTPPKTKKKFRKKPQAVAVKGKKKPPIVATKPVAKKESPKPVAPVVEEEKTIDKSVVAPTENTQAGMDEIQDSAYPPISAENAKEVLKGISFDMLVAAYTPEQLKQFSEFLEINIPKNIKAAKPIAARIVASFKEQ